MTIIDSDLKFYRAEINADGPSNGGRMSANEVPDGGFNNVFPFVPLSERAAGITRWRKIYAKVADAADQTLFLAKVIETIYSLTGDRVLFHLGTQRDTESDITGAEATHGCGYLTNSVTAGATSIEVTIEDGTDVLYRDGEQILLEDGTASSYETITGTPAVSGNVVTLPIAAGIKNSYTGGVTGEGAAVTTVGAVYDYGDLTTKHSVPIISSAAGTLDPAQISLSSIGTVEAGMTLTFTSATAFDLTADVAGVAGSGNTGQNFTPDNPDFPGSPLITIPAAAWGGTWAIGDSVTLATTPAAIPIWCQLIVPQDTAGGPANWQLLFDGETV